jgi:uncharacterized membrane protein YhdT
MGRLMEFLIAWLIFAFVVAIAAGARGRSGIGWFLLSAVLSPLVGLILVLVLPNLRHEQLLKQLADGLNSNPGVRASAAQRPGSPSIGVRGLSNRMAF